MTFKRLIAEKMIGGKIWANSVRSAKRVVASMESQGLIVRVCPSDTNNPNMLGLTEKGAKVFGFKGAVTYQVPRRKKAKKGNSAYFVDREKAKIIIAESMADGFSFSQTAKAAGVSKTTVQRIWREMKEELGWQAQ